MTAENTTERIPSTQHTTVAAWLSGQGIGFWLADFA